MAKEVMKEAPPVVTVNPSQNDADLRATVEKLSAELARVTNLLGQSTEGVQTPEAKAHREWAQKSAIEKTKLVVAAEYPATEPGTKLFEVKLVAKDGKPSEHFQLTIPAHSTEEAAGRYRKIMGINETSGQIVATQAAV